MARPVPKNSSLGRAAFRLAPITRNAKWEFAEQKMRHAQNRALRSKELSHREKMVKCLFFKFTNIEILPSTT